MGDYAILLDTRFCTVVIHVFINVFRKTGCTESEKMDLPEPWFLLKIEAYITIDVCTVKSLLVKLPARSGAFHKTPEELCYNNEPCLGVRVVL